MNIPNELKSQPWSQLLWADVQQYAHNIDAHLSLPEAPTVVDVGGNIGAAALLFHLRYQARVLSIEAIAETYAQLQLNCSSYAHITTVHQAVGASTGSTRFYRYPLAPGLGGLVSSRAYIWKVLSKQAVQQITWSSTKDVVLSPFRGLGVFLWSLFALLIVCTRRQQQVHQETLSKLINAHFEEGTIDLIKIDIEGHELNALQGLEPSEWLRTQAFIIEVHPQHIDEVLCLLKHNGFALVHREPALLQGEQLPEIVIAKRRD